MDNYCVNTQAGEHGEHEIHRSSCLRKPVAQHRLDLGWKNSDQEALVAARTIYPTADGCYYCCPKIHSL